MELLSQNKTKLFASLLHKKYRYQYGFFLAEGEKCVKEAFLSDWPCEALVVIEGHPLPLGIPQGLRIYETTAGQFAKLTDQAHPEGILAVLKIRVPLSIREPVAEGPSLYLDGLQDPGNLGAIFRVADWFGVRNILLGPGSVDPFHPKVVRSSMGSLFRMNLFDLPDPEVWLANATSGVWIADLEGEMLGEVVPADNDVLVIGNETRGIARWLRESTHTRRIRIPGGSDTESLNAAVAAGIILYRWQMP